VSRSQPPQKPRVPLPPLPTSDRFSDYLKVLVDEGVCPNGQRKRRTQVELARAIGRSSKQISNLLNGTSDRPQRKTFDRILHTFFGNEGVESIAWRRAMAEAWARVPSKKATPAKEQPKSERSATSNELPALTSAVYTTTRVPFHFHARDDALTAIASLIIGTSQRIAIYGPHGVGKTVLAAAFAEQHSSTYRVVAWIDARTSESCKAGLIDLGHRLGIVSGTTGGADAVARVLAHLTRQVEPCLIIFDDAVSAADLHPYLPNGQGHVLITSNSPNWQSEAHPIELASWSAEDGATYLTRRLFGADPVAAQELSTDLGGLPLALELVAAFCERRAMTLQTYRQRLVAAPLKDMITDEIRSPGYNRKIDAVFYLSIEAAVAEHAAASVLLEVSSVFPALQVEILRRGWTAMTTVVGVTSDDDALDAALAALRNHSLVSVSAQPAAPPSPLVHRAVRVHPLIGILSRERIVDRNQHRRTVAALLAANLPIGPSAPPLERNEFIVLRTPVELLLAIAQDTFRSSIEFGLLQCRWALVRVLHHHLNATGWQISRRVSRKAKTRHSLVSEPLTLAFAAVRAYRHRTDQEPLVLAAMLQIFGLCLLRYGKTYCAAIVLDHSLRVRTRHLDLHHPDLAEALSAVADCAEQRGRHADALTIRLRVVASRKDIWPHETIEHVHALTRLASSHIQEGHITLALPHLAQALLIEAELTEHNEFPMDITYPVLVSALLHADRRGHLDRLSNIITSSGKTRRDKVDTPARAHMELGFALQEGGDKQAGRDLVFAVMTRLPDPHTARMHALWRLYRYPRDDVPLHQKATTVAMMRLALAQAESLRLPGAIKAASLRLAHCLKFIPGSETEVEALTQPYRNK
jgi:hypothetical protein